MNDLIDRLEKATGPDRGLDGDIAVACGGFPGEPWAFIAHKNGCWRKFLGDFAADGFAILTVNNRDEYNAALAKMKLWREHKG